ncbi:MAG: class I SAM-dependent methyltransferase [Gemmatimonadota bacterium]
MNQAQLYSLYESDPAPVVAFLRHLTDAYGLSGPLRVLDAGCGPGRLLAPLTALGWTVTGLEPDPDYAAAAERTAADLDRASVRRGGFGDIDEASAYDLVAAVNGPYSYLTTFEARRDAVRRAARALRPGGVLFLHFSNFWWILKNYREPPRQTMEIDGITVTRTARHEIDVHAGRFTHVDTFRWSDARGADHEIEKAHGMAMVTPPETERLLRDAGLRDIRTFNGYEDREPSRLTGKSVLIAARRLST